MTVQRIGQVSLVSAIVLGTVGTAIADRGLLRWFADRPVAWHEHDNADTPVAPEPNHLQALQTGLTIRDSVANEADRILALEGATQALDVNALDEVPCSTWYCPRHHLHPLTIEEIAAGPAAPSPVPPLTIVKGKDLGAASGYQVEDANGRRFMLKFDIAGHLGMANAGEMIGNRIFHAAGYNVPGAATIDLEPADLRVGSAATFLLFRVQKRALTERHLQSTLEDVARLPNGRLRAVAVPWIPGKILGGFDMLGLRPGDPNDRIPHQHRRSLRASWVLFAWLSILDPSSINTIDSYVEQNGRRFVRHYFFDFGCAFGSATDHAQGAQQDGEYLVEVGRTLAAFFSLGFYRRPFQDQRNEWKQLTARHPALGYFPGESFDPDAYRTNRKLPSHMRLTERDAYWGAKIVTAFSDAQIAALVATARLPESDAHYIDHALRVRRDIIGRRYLRAFAAIENPRVTADGTRACFDDLAILRGYAQPRESRYVVETIDGWGNPLTAFEQGADGIVACVPIGSADAGGGYRVVRLRTRTTSGAGGQHTSKATRIHLRWRDSEHRFVVVGLERDE